MMIPHKETKDTMATPEKKSYFNKLVSKYTAAYTKYSKKHSKDNYKKNILNWFFSLDLKTQQIVASIENHHLSRKIIELYELHRSQPGMKFYITDLGGPPLSIKENQTSSEIDTERLLATVLFYQTELGDPETNYFTLNKDFLINKETFIHIFNNLSNNDAFKNPIKTSHDVSSKIHMFELPSWINTPDNVCEKTYYTISQYLAAYFEQVISVSYIISTNKGLNEIISNSHFREVLESINHACDYVNEIGFDNIFENLNIKKIIQDIHGDSKVRKFVKDKKAVDEKNWFSCPVNFTLSKDLEKTINDFRDLVKKSNETEDFVYRLEMLNFYQVYTFEDFMFRKVFESILGKLADKNMNELLDQEVRTKKKKKKRKKSNKELASTTAEESPSNDEKSSKLEQPSTPEPKKETENSLSQESTSNKPEVTTSDDTDLNHPEKSKKKKLFLYDTVKKKPKKKNLAVEKTEPSQITISSGVNSITISPSSPNESEFSSFTITSNPSISIFLDLEKSIQAYIEEMKGILVEEHKKKFAVKDSLQKICSKLFPTAYISVYGSILYGTDIPQSDLDISMITPNSTSLQIFYEDLKTNHKSKFISMLPLFETTVPIIKCKLNTKDFFGEDDKFDSSEVRIDISVNAINSTHINYVQSTLNSMPIMIPVIKIIKQLLYKKKLNVPFEGGLGSYCLFIMIYSYFKRCIFNTNYTSSQLLIEFLFFYGTTFNPELTYIDVRWDDPFIASGEKLSLPVILDPVTLNQLGKKFTSFAKVFETFNKFYSMIFMVKGDITKALELI